MQATRKRSTPVETGTRSWRPRVRRSVVAKRFSSVGLGWVELERSSHSEPEEVLAWRCTDSVLSSKGFYHGLYQDPLRGALSGSL